MRSPRPQTPQDRIEILAKALKITHHLLESDGINSLLEVLVDLLVELLGAERGFIMLENRESRELEMQVARNFSKSDLEQEEFVVSYSIINSCHQTGQPILTSNAQTDQRFRQAQSVKNFKLRSVLCAPIFVKKESVGVLYVDNTLRSGAFGEQDLEFLESFSQKASQLIEETLLKTQYSKIRQLFERYLSPSVAHKLLHRKKQELTSHTQEATILFVDIRGFTSITEQRSEEETIALLNQFYGLSQELLDHHHGTILSFLGDGLLATFGYPIPHHNPEPSALTFAKKLHLKIEKQLSLQLGFGIASGEVIAGDIGTDRRREFTVVGDVVNTASRLQNLSKKYSYPILVDQQTAQKSQDPSLKYIGDLVLRGKEKKVPVWGYRP